MPQCDSSQTGMRAVRPEPSPADLQPDWTAGVSEVSRFSCMKFRLCARIRNFEDLTGFLQQGGLG